MNTDEDDDFFFEDDKEEYKSAGQVEVAQASAKLKEQLTEEIEHERED